MIPVRAVNELLPRTSLLAAAMLFGCAHPMTTRTAQVSVWARSHNRSTMDVYLLCGDREPRWLGVIGPNEAGALNFPSGQARCVQGLNFYLVDRDRHRGYWVGPMHLQRGFRIDLVIERYAGLSTVKLSRE